MRRTSGDGSVITGWRGCLRSPRTSAPCSAGKPASTEARGSQHGSQDGVGGSQGAPAERSGDSFQLVADLWALSADFELVKVLSVVAVAHLDDVHRAAGRGVQLDVAQLDQVMEQERDSSSGGFRGGAERGGLAGDHQRGARGRI